MSKHTTLPIISHHTANHELPHRVRSVTPAADCVHYSLKLPKYGGILLLPQILPPRGILEGRRKLLHLLKISGNIANSRPYCTFFSCVQSVNIFYGIFYLILLSKIGVFYKNTGVQLNGQCHECYIARSIR
jgi:hypothetical protein